MQNAAYRKLALGLNILLEDLIDQACCVPLCLIVRQDHPNLMILHSSAHGLGEHQAPRG